MPKKEDEYAKAMRLALQNVREPTQAPGEGVSAHARAAAVNRMLQEKADAQRAQAKKEAQESDARMRQLGVEMQQKLEVLRDSDEYQPPRQEQIELLQYCTGKNNAKVTVEKAGHYHQMAAAEAILARELYAFGARKYMQYGRTPGTKKGTVLLEARNEAANNLYPTQLQTAMEKKGYVIEEIWKLGRDGMRDTVVLDKPFREVKAVLPAPTFEVHLTGFPDRGMELMGSLHFKAPVAGIEEVAEFNVSYTYGGQVGLELDFTGSGAQHVTAWVVGMMQLGISHTELELVMWHQLINGMPAELAGGVAGVTIEREAVFNKNRMALPMMALATKMRPKMLLLVPEEQKRKEILALAKGTLSFGELEVQVGWTAPKKKEVSEVGMSPAMDKLMKALDKRALAPKECVVEMQQWVEKAEAQRAEESEGIDVGLMLELVFDERKHQCLPKAQTCLTVLYEEVQAGVKKACQEEPASRQAKKNWKRVKSLLQEGVDRVQTVEELVQVTIAMSSSDGRAGKMPKPAKLGIMGSLSPDSIRNGVQQLLSTNGIEVVGVEVVYVPSPPAMGLGPWFGEESLFVAVLTKEKFQDLTAKMQADNLIEISALPTAVKAKKFLFRVSRKAQNKTIGASAEEIAVAKEKIMEYLEDLHAFAVPTTTDGLPEGGMLTKRTTKMSEMSMENVGGIWDIRRIQECLPGVSAGACEGIMNIVYSLRDEGKVEFVEASEGPLTILVMEARLARALHRNWDLVDKEAVINGEDNRKHFKDALERDLVPMIHEAGEEGFWMAGEVVEKSQKGTSADDLVGCDEEEVLQEAPRFWQKVFADHPLGAVNKGKHVKYVILDVLNEECGLTAISKQGSLLVVQTGGFVPALLQANKNEGIVPGQSVDFDKLPEADEDKKGFETELLREMRVKKLVWVPGGTFVDKKLGIEMSKQKNTGLESDLLFPQLSVKNPTYQKGGILPRALQRIYESGGMEVVAYPGVGLMLLANGPTSKRGVTYKAADEYVMTNLRRKVSFGKKGATELLEANAESFFVDQTAGLDDSEDPHIVLGAVLKEEGGIKSIVYMDEETRVPEAMLDMDLGKALLHPMLNTPKGLEILARSEDLFFVNVSGGVMVYSKNVNPKWGIHMEAQGGLVGWNPESGWDGLEEWAAGMVVDDEEMECSDEEMEGAELAEAKNNGSTRVSKLHGGGKCKGRKGAAAKGGIGVKQIARNTVRDMVKNQGLEVCPSINLENVAHTPSE
jgi:hypothetical protein